MGITFFSCFQDSPLMQKIWACHYPIIKLKGHSGKSMAQSGDIFNSEAELNNWNIWSRNWPAKCSWVAGPVHMKAAVATEQQLHLYFLLMSSEESDVKTAKSPHFPAGPGRMRFVVTEEWNLELQAVIREQLHWAKLPKGYFPFFFLLFHFPRQKSCSFRSFRIFSSNWKSSGVTPAQRQLSYTKIFPVDCFVDGSLRSK